MYQNDLSTSTLEVVLGRGAWGTRVTLDLIIRALIAYQKHHYKAVHTGEQTMKHFNESHLSNEWAKINDKDVWAIRAALKRYHVDFHIEQTEGSAVLFFRAKDHRLINYALEQVVKSAMEAQKYQVQESQDQDHAPADRSNPAIEPNSPVLLQGTQDQYKSPLYLLMSNPERSEKTNSAAYVEVENSLRSAFDKLQSFMKRSMILDDSSTHAIGQGIEKALSDVVDMLNQPIDTLTPDIMQQAAQKTQQAVDKLEQAIAALDAEIQKISNDDMEQEQDKIYQAFQDGKIHLRDNGDSHSVIISDKDREIYRGTKEECEHFLDSTKPRMDKQIAHARIIQITNSEKSPDLHRQRTRGMEH
ncbi:DUF3801 domain-containing protein [Intestinibacillus sp. Marseille-P6563]|uniref:DUF3801 domain-containing protein n=1 Tax=Intestinibacillus sp. Marseille-P6563 TaxID=2364792 RepID=UPI000F071E13|nr:DUF3801 domain-containing protein [Intestinibacillus sp. Marseille-P6563]